MSNGRDPTPASAIVVTLLTVGSSGEDSRVSGAVSSRMTTM